MTRQLVRYATLLGGLVFATASGWWDGFDLDLEQYMQSREHRGYVTDASYPGSFERAAWLLHKDLLEVAIDDLVSRCESVIQAGLAAEVDLGAQISHGADVHFHFEVGGPRVRDWLLCAVAVRRMGESKDPGWLTALERLHDLWPEAAGRQWAESRLSIAIALGMESVDAYGQIALGDVGLAELAVDMRESILDPDRSPRSRLESSARSAARRRLSQRPPWPAEYRALWTDPDPTVRKRILGGTSLVWVPRSELRWVLGLLADPVPEIREAAELMINGRIRGALRRDGSLSPTLPTKLTVIPPLLAFLSRDDIDDDARKLAEESLRLRGFVPLSGPEGLRASPINGDGEEILAEPD